MLEKEYIPKKEEKEKIEKSKEISIIEGCSYSIGDGFGLRYIIPFSIHLRANDFQVGVISSFPGLIGNIVSNFTIKLMEKFSRKEIITKLRLIQSFLWIPLIAIAIIYFFYGTNLVIPLIFFYTIFILIGALAGPAWNSWMKDLVSEKERGTYFGKRNKICGFVAIACFFIAGLVLDYFKILELTSIGFALLFFISFISFLLSFYYFHKIYEPKFKPEKKFYFSFFDFVKRMPSSNFGRFVIFYSLLAFSVAVASPFFAVYMLKYLKFSYTSFMIVSLAAPVSQILFFAVWGKFADKYGNASILKFCSFFVFLIPVLWVISVFSVLGNFLVFYLFLVEFFSGFVWAGVGLSAGNFIYDAVTRQRLAICIIYFNILTSFSSFFGAAFGGYLSDFLIQFFESPLIIIFLISAFLRLLVYLIFSGGFAEVKRKKRFDATKFIFEFKEEISKVSSLVTVR